MDWLWFNYSFKCCFLTPSTDTDQFLFSTYGSSQSELHPNSFPKQSCYYTWQWSADYCNNCCNNCLLASSKRAASAYVCCAALHLLLTQDQSRNSNDSIVSALWQTHVEVAPLPFSSVASAHLHASHSLCSSYMNMFTRSEWVYIRASGCRSPRPSLLPVTVLSKCGCPVSLWQSRNQQCFGLIKQDLTWRTQLVQPWDSQKHATIVRLHGRDSWTPPPPPIKS